jgi:hypothetical protein
MTEATVKYSDVRPGDRLIFERPGGIIYGGVVWQSPTTGAILAGDTFLTLHGRWLDEPTGDGTMTLDTTHRRAGENGREQTND